MISSIAEQCPSSALLRICNKSTSRRDSRALGTTWSWGCDPEHQCRGKGQLSPRAVSAIRHVSTLSHLLVLAAALRLLENSSGSIWRPHHMFESTDMGFEDRIIGKPGASAWYPQWPQC